MGIIKGNYMGIIICNMGIIWELSRNLKHGNYMGIIKEYVSIKESRIKNQESSTLFNVVHYKTNNISHGELFYDS